MDTAEVLDGEWESGERMDGRRGGEPDDEAPRAMLETEWASLLT